MKTSNAAMHFEDAAQPAVNHSPSLPMLTIITPSFNQGQFLEETIRSVIDQGYPKLEYMIFDGGSGDQSLEVIRQYEARLSYWTSEKDRGQSHALNKGLRRAKGDVIGWINSDDLYLPGCFQSVAGHFTANPDVHIVCGFLHELNERSGRIKRITSSSPTAHSLPRVNTVAQQSVFFRRSVLEEVGLLDESLHFAMDWDYWNRILAAGFRFSVIPRFLALSRQHPASKTATLRHVWLKEELLVHQRYLGRAIPEREAARELGARWWLAHRLVRGAGLMGLMNNGSGARLMLRLRSALTGGK